MDEQELREAYEAWRDGLVNDPAFVREVAALAERARRGEIPPDKRSIAQILEEHRKRFRAE